jgi:uncharacterized protein (DUF4415 family)
MNKREVVKEFVPGQGYSKQDWDEVSDNPELTAEELTQMRPFAEVFPELADNIRRGRGRPTMDNPKQQVTLRLDAEVLTRLRASGKGWQARVNAMLRKDLGL